MLVTMLKKVINLIKRLLLEMDHFHHVMEMEEQTVLLALIAQVLMDIPKNSLVLHLLQLDHHFLLWFKDFLCVTVQMELLVLIA